MWIEIKENLKPFSHQRGSFSYIPKTLWSLQAFPCKWVISHYQKQQKKELFFPFLGIVEEFTTEIDLTTHKVKIFGKEKRGYFRFEIFYEKGEVFLFVDKLFEESIAIVIDGKNVTLKKKQKVFLVETDTFISLSQEKLFLGINKALDMDFVERRRDLKEIFPLWFSLGKDVPFSKFSKNPKGSLLELEKIENLLKEKKTLEVVKSFEKAFVGGFLGIFHPQINDRLYQGIFEEVSEDGLCPLELLKKGSKIIRSLFIKEEADVLYLLPNLLPSFVCGKFTHITLSCGSRFYLEWTKGCLRRAMIKCESNREVIIKLPKSTKSFRLKESLKGKGVLLKEGSPLQLAVGKCLFLDRFQH